MGVRPWRLTTSPVPSPEPSNLQGLCHPCHQAKTESSYLPTEEEHRAIRDAFRAFVDEDDPVMLAHGEDWAQQWRALHRQNLDWALERCTVGPGLVVAVQPDGTWVVTEEGG